MTNLLSFIFNLLRKLKFQSKLNNENIELPTKISLSIEPQSKIAKWTMYFYCFSALILSMSMGTVIGWSSPALNNMKMDNNSIPRIQSDNTIDCYYMTWIGSCITLGALSGSLFCGIISNHFGKRIILLSLSIPFIIGWLIISFAQSFLIIIFGRIITGCCVGIICNIVPGYISDIVTPNRRGFLGICFQLLCSIGALYSSYFGMILSWKNLSLISIIPLIISLIGMYFSPESPVYLLQNNKTKLAIKVLKKIRSNNSDIINELIELEDKIYKNNNNNNNNNVKRKFLTLIKRSDINRPLIICVMLQFFQQFSGINAIMFYLVSIFNDSGTNIDPQLSSIIINFTLFISCLFSGLFIDCIGRRLWLILSSLGMFITMLIMSLYYYLLINYHQITNSLPLYCLIIFSISFAMGFGPIPWMIVNEITPSDGKNLVSSFSSSTNWLCAFIITKQFDYFIQLFNKQGVYLIFSIFNFLSLLFVIIFVPETKNIINNNEKFTKFSNKY